MALLRHLAINSDPKECPDNQYLTNETSLIIKRSFLGIFGGRCFIDKYRVYMF
jgi:hypothetical protein